MGTSFAARALPQDLEFAPYKQYEIIKDIPNVSVGTAVPWFDQPGGGTQYMFDIPIEVLVLKGYLREIK